MEFPLTNTISNNNEELLSAIKDTKNVLKSFTKLSTKHANIIRINDIQAEELSKENIEKVKELSNNLTDPKLNKMLDVMYNNFEIVNNSFNIFRAYTDEYYERFNKLEATFSNFLTTLEKDLIKGNKS